ncbi:MAG: glycosyltransferase [Patescibacteria group bacterium]|jgi:glycosyltransferase involved in cell wall biosynthesis
MENKDINISVCLVVYNEEKNIRRCLDSLHDVVDEIIVVHDGDCLDRTLDICQEYGAKIFMRPHAGMMEAHLVFAIEQARGRWVLRIDADEFLSEGLKSNLRGLIKKAEIEGISAYSFRWLDYPGRKSGRAKKQKSILFKKAELYWFSMPHLSWQTRKRLEESNLILGHAPKDYETSVYWDGQKKWASIQARYILEDFDNLDNFQASRGDWLKVYGFSRRYAGSRFLSVMKFFKSFGETFLGGAGLEESWRCGLYNFYLGKYLYDLVHHR